MKKFLALLMAMLLLVGCLAACSNKNGGSDDVSGDSNAASLTDAVAYLQGLYKDAAKKTPMDYDVVGKILIGTTVFTVEWSVDVDEITVKKSSKEGFYTIDVPDVTTEEIPYVLTATVKDAAGKSQKKSFDRYVPVVDNSALVTAPEEGTAYKFFLDQNSLGQTLYATTEISGTKYIASTTDAASGADFFAEKSGDGYKFYIEVNGAKKYLHAHTEKAEDGKVSKYLGYADTTDNVWTYVADVNAWVVSIDKTEYVVGTYSTYNTFCISEKSYITPENSGVSQFPAGFITPDNAANKEPAADIETYDDAEAILKAAYAMDKGKVLSGGKNYTLTGKITEVNSAYSADYGNITVTIVVGNLTKYPIECFRLKGNGIDKIGKGDTITVTGQILKYDDGSDNGKVEFNSGCTLDSYKSSGNKDDGVLTNATLKPVEPQTGKAYKMAFVQKNIQNTAYFLTGKLSGFYAASTTTEKDGADFYIEKATDGYYLYAKVDGKKYYVNIEEAEGTDGKMHTNIKYETKKSTVYTYNKTLKTFVTKLGEDEYAPLGTDATKTYTTLGPRKTSGDNIYAQFVVKGTTTSAPDKEEEDDGDKEDVKLTAVTKPAANTAYKLFFVQVSAGKTLFALNTTQDDKNKFVNATEKGAEAPDFYVEKVTGGYKIYTKVGNDKMYLNATTTVDGDKTSKFLGFAKTSNSVYTYDSTVKAWITTIDGKDYVVGTYGTYTTLSISDKSFITAENTGKTQFPMAFVKSSDVKDTTPSTPPAGDDDDDDEKLTAVTAPAANTAYKLFFVQVSAGKTLFALNTTQDDKNKFVNATENASEAPDFYVEKVTGGYKIYTKIDNKKMYLNGTTTVDGTKVSKFLGFAETSTTVYKYDSTVKAWITTIDGKDYVVGTYGTYTTLSLSDKSFITAENTGKTQFPMAFVKSADVQGTTPTPPPAGGDDDDDDDDNTGSTTTVNGVKPEVGKAYVIGFINTNKSATDIYYLTGVLDGYYAASTTTLADAAKFYVENATDGYYVYAMVGGAKKYVNIVTSTSGDKTYVNVKFEDAKSTVYTYDEARKTIVSDVNGAEYAVFATSGTGSYTTLGPRKTTTEDIYGQFVLTEDGGTTPPAGGDDDDDTTGGELQVGTAYLVGVINPNLSETDVYYLTGVLSGYYAASTTDKTAAAKFYVENATDGYYVYAMVAGAKKYVNVVVDNTYVNVKFEDAKSTVYTYDATLKTVVTDVNGTEYAVFATRNDKTYTTLGPVKTANDPFVGEFILAEDGGTTPPPAGGDDEEDDDDTTGGELQVGTAYLVGVINPNKSATDVYYLTGEMSGYYAASTTTLADAAKFYVENATDGYYVYAMVGTAKKYVNVVVDNTYTNVKFEDAKSTVYTYSETLKTVVTDVNGTEFAVFATRSDKNYTTLGPVKTANDPFVGEFILAEEGGTTPPPSGGDDEDDDDNTGSDTELSIKATFEFGDDKSVTAHTDNTAALTGNKTYTEGAYTLVVTSPTKVYDKCYDKTGNCCLKLGSSSAVGSFSFTVGDDVSKVVINIAQYKSRATKVKINGTEYTITTASDNGEYTAIEIDTTSVKTITIAGASSSNGRCMIDSIVYMG